MINILFFFEFLDSLCIGFGLSIALMSILSLLKHETLNQVLHPFFNHSIKVIRVLGLVYLLLYIVYLLLVFTTSEATLFYLSSDNAYETMHWLMLFRPLILCGLTQLFWIKRIKNSKGVILFLAFLITLIALVSGVNFQRLVILVTSIHRDYVPSNWEPYHGFLDFSILFFLVVIKNVVLFSGLVFLTGYFSKKNTTLTL